MAESNKSATPKVDTKIEASADSSSDATPVKVSLRYLGMGDILKDAQTNTTWIKNGAPQTVSAADAARLEALPYHMWERITTEAKK